MNTFLPYPDFVKSAKVLDNKRLGKQRVEALQLVQVLTGETSAWANHPCTKMWRGYQGALVQYGIIICREWMARGFKDSVMEKLEQYSCEVVMTPWFGCEAFHASHRANLLRKDAVWYGRFGWTEHPMLPYVWPV